LISLLTDFGLRDPFVAEMKAVMLSICPEVRIIDISNVVEKFDIKMGSFLLASAAPYFPNGTVHVAVIDPGVGSRRRPIVVQTPRSIFVGPDNGLLVPAATAEGISHVYEITHHSIMRNVVSATFHGRDVFAPVGAHLARGLSPSEVGREIRDYVRAPYAEPTFQRGNAICEVLHIDTFGNVVTNLTRTQFPKLHLKLGKNARMAIGKKRLAVRLVRTYSDLKMDELGILIGSHGFVEVACRETSAAKRLRTRTGGRLRVYGA
jgi:S-adenosylmethionine hydrolase